MAAGPPPADQAASLLQKLSLDAQSTAQEIPESTKEPATNQCSSVDSGNAPNSDIAPQEQSVTPVMHDINDPAVCYLPNGYTSTGYYYGGYDGAVNNWDDLSRYENDKEVDMASGFYGDNGSLMYPSYSVAPYGPYSSAASSLPMTEQLYGTRQYHYPSNYFQSLPASVPNDSSLYAPPQAEVFVSAPADQKSLPVDPLGPKNGGTSNARSCTLRSTHQNSGYNTDSSLAMASMPRSMPSGYQDRGFGYDRFGSSIPWSDAPAFAIGQPGRVTNSGIMNPESTAKNDASPRNQGYRANSQIMGLHHPGPLSGISAVNRSSLYPYNVHGQYGNTVRSGMGFRYDSRTYGRGWLGMDNKYKNRGYGGGHFGYSNDNMDGLNELNRGPRGNGSKNQKSLSTVTQAVEGQNLPSSGRNKEEKTITSAMPDREQYNKADFPEEYADAKFFVIKSYGEDDVHESIKYNVWASTPNGNKKLDAAYREAQEKAGECPVFLFFSVNTSGQFVGVAEMMGAVDFERSVEYWQQDKWNGHFPLKWHIVKDVPNRLLKHIILEYNENKPVTNSRDTQEVKLEQGLQMIKIFKDHSSRTCLLDDFEFYENRQKTIQEKKARQQFQKQCRCGKEKLMNEKKETANGEEKLQKSSEVSTDPVK